MHPKHWGKHFWITLYSVALDYPLSPNINDQFHYKRFYMDLKYVLPCKKCRKGFIKNVAQLPIEPFLRGGRESLFTWVLRINNAVNQENGQALVTKQEIMSRYFSEDKTKASNENKQEGGGEGEEDNSDNLKNAAIITLGVIAMNLYYKSN